MTTFGFYKQPLTLAFACFLTMAVSVAFSVTAYADGLATHSSNPGGVHIVGLSPQAPEVTSVLALIDDLLESSNQHQLDALVQHYSPRFVSGDNLSLNEVQELIEDTWESYPDIQYKSKTLEIRFHGDWATIESQDTAQATAQPTKKIPDMTGSLHSRSRGLLFLHRLGKTWEIVSDYTVYEEAWISYGKTQDLDLRLSAPDQIFGGETYTARLQVELPKNTFAIASISKDALQFPQPTPVERFRTITYDKKHIERTFDGNTSNRNELITAVIGLTTIEQDEKHQRPTVELGGVATLVKRVNVLPRPNPENEASKALTKTSASGLIQVSDKPSQK